MITADEAYKLSLENREIIKTKLLSIVFKMIDDNIKFGKTGLIISKDEEIFSEVMKHQTFIIEKLTELGYVINKPTGHFGQLKYRISWKKESNEL